MISEKILHNCDSHNANCNFIESGTKNKTDVHINRLIKITVTKQVNINETTIRSNATKE